MGKRDAYGNDLAPLLDQYFEGKMIRPLIDYLQKNSNLPGPRANLELADAFVGAVEGYGDDLAWKLSGQLREFTSDRAPTNDPGEFVAFCGTRLLGSIGTSPPEEEEVRVLSVLRTASRDPRWRVREGVAMSIQTMIDHDSGVVDKLGSWVVDGAWLEMRAVAAGVAEPRLMKKEGVPERALQLHKKIIARVMKRGDNKSEEFRALRKTLGYSLSVIVCGIPGLGFEYLRELSKSGDGEVVWIVKENLKKDGLKRASPQDVRSISSTISG